jgi:2-polyprenyl-3-methyl-5-hydroxy-6-metoxy-1,4-benzoquinol methylase
MTACLLCKGDSIVTIEQIAANDIAVLYKRSFGVDVLRLFQARAILFQQCNSCGLRFFDPPVVGDEKFYADMQQFDWYYVQEKAEYHFAASLITEGDLVLDIGCGRGAFARIIGVHRFTGLDSSARAREQAKMAGINVEQGTIQDYAVHNREKYDVVCGFQVLEHVNDIHGFIASSVECLRSGGLLIYSVPSDDSYLSSSSNAATNLPPHHVSRWTDKALRSIGMVFSLDELQLHYEEVSREHLRSYGQTVVARKIRSLFGITPRLVDVSFADRFLNKVGWTLAPLIAAKCENAIGHTVTIVLKKR